MNTSRSPKVDLACASRVVNKGQWIFHWPFFSSEDPLDIGKSNEERLLKVQIRSSPNRQLVK